MKPHQISAFFLLVTVLLSSTLAQNGSGPEKCCFTYFPGSLRLDLIERYVETRGDCSKPGIILHTTKDNELCVNPEDHWVQWVKKKLDQRLHGSGPEECCFTYFPGRLSMELITGSEGTKAECPKPGIIFHTKKGWEVCVNPEDHWVQRVMKELDQRLHGNRPDQCCFTYFPGRLRMGLIAGYEETRGDCSKPGIILNTKKGNEMCVDPSDHWVQVVKKRLDQLFFQSSHRLVHFNSHTVWFMKNLDQQ